MAPHERASVAAHPAGGDHQNGDLRRKVVEFSDGGIVRCKSLDRGRWMFDGHDSHYSALGQTREQVPFRNDVALAAGRFSAIVLASIIVRAL